MATNIARSFRNNILVGLILIIPIAVTVWIVNFLFKLTTKWVIAFVPSPWLKEYSAVLFQAAALIIVLLVLFLIGFLTRNFLGKKLYQFGDTILARTPFINKIYISVRQISEAILDQSQTMFKEVVVVEYPRKGAYAIGFTTAVISRDVTDLLPERKDEDYVAVFVATVPNPTSGFFIIFPRSDVRVLPMSVADGMKMVISAGAVYPGAEPLDNRPTLLDKLEKWVARENPK